MLHPLSIDKRKAIKIHLLEMQRQNKEDDSDIDESNIATPKLDHMTIADELSLLIQTVKNYSANLKRFSSILPPAIVKKGRPCSLTRAIIDVSYIFNET